MMGLPLLTTIGLTLVWYLEEVEIQEAAAAAEERREKITVHLMTIEREG